MIHLALLNRISILTALGKQPMPRFYVYSVMAYFEFGIRTVNLIFNSKKYDKKWEFRCF